MFRFFMFKLICYIISIFFAGAPVMTSNLITQLYNCNQIYLINNGVEVKLENSVISSELETLFADAYFTPAFGVALHHETVNQLKSGLWLEFRFNKQHVFNQMPYKKLLIKFEPDLYGFNIIRFNNGKYDGRCYYLNLKNNTTNFYNFLTTIK